MPRRRVSKGRSAASSAGRSRGKKGASVQGWNTREDIPLDEVDQFHEQRDKILLEGDADVDVSEDGEEEVFALKGIAELSDDENGENDENEEGYDDEDSHEMERRQMPSKSKGKPTKASKKPPESSSEDDEEEEEEESWGRKKSVFYSSNAAQLDSDDEEAHEMEEKEARRLQAKLREPMREEDFGFSEALQASFDTEYSDDFWSQSEKSNLVAEVPDRISRLRLLQKTSPEVLALAQEWEDVARSVMKTEKDLSRLDLSDPAVAPTIGMVHLHYQTQLTYAALLAFYLHLRSSGKYAAKPELLRQHPILKRLLVLKQSLAALEDLSFSLSDSELGSDEDDLDVDLDDDEESFSLDDELQKLLASRSQGFSARDIEQLLLNGLRRNPKESNEESSRTREVERPKKKRKFEESYAEPKIAFDVEEPTLSKPSKKPIKPTRAADTYGEATALDIADAADKRVHRKALRFHTAKIESASARRQGARNALGGDDDIPYRERKKQMAEKQKRRDLGAGGDDLDDAEPESKKRSRDEDSDLGGSGSEDDDGYYSLVKKQKAAMKEAKKAEYEAKRGANRVDIEEDYVEGQRGVTRAILKNKGLTPKRSKSVRNPRVKKRQKFEKAKKKIASQKAIYKGGIGDSGRYDGEKSGISKVVKSIKI